MEGVMSGTQIHSWSRFNSLALMKQAQEQLEELRQICRNVDNRHFKAASLGGDAEQSFEQAFSTLAFTHVKDQAPRLMDYLIGFQLVERADNNEKAVGVFGFKLRDNFWLYAPVFFVNGQLKGNELLFVKSHDQFVPLKENWVNHLLGRKPHTLGEGTPESLRSMGMQNPDIRSLSNPPQFGKYGSAEIDPGLAKALTESPNTKMGYGALAEHFDLRNFLKLSSTNCFMMKRALDQYPALREAVGKFYGNPYKLVADAVRHVKQAAHEQKLHTPLPPRPKVEFIGSMMDKRASMLSDHETEQLIRQGYLFRDFRKISEVSTAFDTEGQKIELVNPEESGLTEILQRSSKYEKMLVLHSPHSCDGRKRYCTILEASGSPRAWMNCHGSSVWAKPNTSSPEDYREWFNGLSDSKSLSVDSTYVAVNYSLNQGLDGSVPFTVENDLGDGRYEVRFHDSADYSRPDTLPIVQNESSSYARGSNHYDSRFRGQPKVVALNDRPGTRFKSIDNMLLVPADAKLIKIKKPSEEDCCYWSRSDREAIIQPGNWADLEAEILQKTAELKVFNDGVEVTINNGPNLTQKQALAELVTDYGLREKAAHELLKKAHVKFRARRPGTFRIKYANPYPMLQPGPTAPAFPEPQYGSDMSFGAYPTIESQEEFIPVDDLATGRNDLSGYDASPEAMPDPMALQSAMMAAQQGQKEVFDTSMVTALLRSARNDSLVDRFNGDLMRALDRLGRIILLFHWNNQKFVNRYGKADLPELEDSLKTTFDVLGDLVLFLREKDIEPFSDVLGQPNISEPGE